MTDAADQSGNKSACPSSTSQTWNRARRIQLRVAFHHQAADNILRLISLVNLVPSFFNKKSISTMFQAFINCLLGSTDAGTHDHRSYTWMSVREEGRMLAGKRSNY